MSAVPWISLTTDYGLTDGFGGPSATPRPGGLVAYVDSAGLVAVAVNGGRAADLLAASPGDLLRVSG